MDGEKEFEAIKNLKASVEAPPSCERVMVSRDDKRWPLLEKQIAAFNLAMRHVSMIASSAIRPDGELMRKIERGGLVSVTPSELMAIMSGRGMSDGYSLCTDCARRMVEELDETARVWRDIIDTMTGAKIEPKQDTP